MPPDPDDANQLVDGDPNGNDAVPEDDDTTADDDAGDDAGDASDAGDAEPEPKPAAAPELSADDKKWLALAKESGVTPEQARFYMAKGYDAQQIAVAAEAAKKDGGEPEGDDEDVLPVSRGELNKTLASFAQQNVKTAAAMQAEATIEGLLDASDFAGDDRSREMIKADAWKLLQRGGVKPREAFRQASKGHSSWLAGQATRTNRKKVEAKKTGGSTGGGAGAPATEPEPLNLKHREDDFQTGEADHQATEFMRKAAKV